MTKLEKIQSLYSELDLSEKEQFWNWYHSREFHDESSYSTEIRDLIDRSLEEAVDSDKVPFEQIAWEKIRSSINSAK